MHRVLIDQKRDETNFSYLSKILPWLVHDNLANYAHVIPNFHLERAVKSVILEFVKILLNKNYEEKMKELMSKIRF